MSSPAAMAAATLTGAQADAMKAAASNSAGASFYGKNGSNTKDAKLNRLTRISAILIFVITLAVNIIYQIKK